MYIKMNTAEIIGIFPTPIYTNKLDREFTKKEINFFTKEKEKKFKNVGNNSSDNNYILNSSELKNLKQELNEIVKDYFKKIISIDEKASPYITQSWLNWTNEKEFHHRHSHSNSIVSGVLYINVDEKNDKINFFKDENSQIYIREKETNMYNTNNVSLVVKNSLVILFPSYLDHAVDVKQGNNVRVSLAFNTFVKGTIGLNKALTELIL